MTREDVQDELCAVDHAPFGGLLDIALLNRAEVAVEDDQPCLMGSRFRPDLFELSAPDQRGRIRRIAKLKNGRGYLRARAARQLYEFGQRFPAAFPDGHSGKARRTFPSDAHEQRALSNRHLMLLCFTQGDKPGVMREEELTEERRTS